MGVRHFDQASQYITLFKGHGTDSSVDKADIAGGIKPTSDDDAEAPATSFDPKQLTVILHWGVLLEGPPRTSTNP